MHLSTLLRQPSISLPLPNPPPTPIPAATNLVSEYMYPHPASVSRARGPGFYTFVSPSADSSRAVVSFWRKYVHKVLVNRLGGLSLPRKSVGKLTDRPDMTIDVYHGRKTTT